MKNLNQLINVIEPVKTINFINRQISSIEYDSRKCSNDSIFVAIRGNNLDGHRFISAAIKKGAKTIICESLSPDTKNFPDCTFIKVSDSRNALAMLSHYWFDEPSKKLKIIGITGTNGKTTLTFLLKSIFHECGYKCGIIGTTGIFMGNEFIPATHTTPESLELASVLNNMVQKGIEYVFMEVSSHSLEQRRINGIVFDAALFTNLTHDHLDYHINFDSYAKAKKKLFDNLTENSFALANSDDDYCDFILSDCKSRRKYKIGRNTNSDIIITEEQISLNKASFILSINRINDTSFTETYSFEIHLTGRFNITNAAMAAATGLALNLDYKKILKGLIFSKGAPGRMETIILKNGAVAIIDYAHTPDALEKALLACREIIISQSSSSKLICVFGCGGDRDKSKRPAMGSISSFIADYSIITSDNPRTEDADKIIQEIYAGISKKNKSKINCITNRSEAIAAAYRLSRQGDIILIAGKGHEKYQIIGTEKIPFDDVEEVMKFA